MKSLDDIIADKTKAYQDEIRQTNPKPANNGVTDDDFAEKRNYGRKTPAEIISEDR